MSAVVADETLGVQDVVPAGDGAWSSPNVLKANVLYTAVSDALNFAAAATEMVTAIAAVRIEASETQLVAVATNRFVLGVSRVDYQGAPFAVTIAVDDAKTLARMAKTAKRDGPGVRLKSVSTVRALWSCFGSTAGSRSPLKGWPSSSRRVGET
ncbi:hypothetical protein [Mycobacterium xenopi]|uniref:hypothetical protein n=1 Tax=Mycobacterium xenopi TaxID=1789 RepID=UPI001FD3C7E1|nr:hypothetical protein [Mycobacterium xenopi]